MKSIGKNVFNGCRVLKTITMKNTKPIGIDVKADALKDINSRETFKCPKAKLPDYMNLFVKKEAQDTAKLK